ncbi:bacillithiol biosynthesis cysteine-adding enzyme BshC [Salibacterium qingdaonense]|uniref:Putative cysteine ligase BshC n=1 Tax=Salibacterium qingdaonense TaxID=266892 RepID=A0A1I4IXC4_9BACI|nr:bacillithiol biosynthesis cysteine-adding enzyme BshC [Salibacterium qingdaonense]SFL58501.1 bacillithiol biosynthesis cysteine-adding enzyme BshC [Salibacterium qingdaonense]
MQAETVPSFHRTSFVEDYIKQEDRALSFFDYGLSDEDIEKRVKEVTSKSFQRTELYNVLYTYNQKHSCSRSTLEQLKKMKDPESSVVITGQQAGLLTGPLYTIFKAVTVLKEAEEKEKQIKKPVLPVFWIAGEDHDWEEVNHIYLPGETAPSKITYQGEVKPGHPVSEQKLETAAFEAWWQEVSKVLHETPHTKELYESFKEIAGRSDSVSDFFAEVMHWLFSGSGLILMDASDQGIRNLESTMFQQLVNEHEVVEQALKQGLKNRGETAYGRPDGFQENSSHFFYHDPNRILLYKEGVDDFSDKNGRVHFSSAFLKEEAARHPEKFSTDALTRPLIQDMLLPVLAYVGGPGEINYWSVLQPLFHQFSRFVPPVIARVEGTIVPRNVQSALNREHLFAEDLLRHGPKAYVTQIRQNAVAIDGTVLGEELLQNIRPYHDRMRSAWETIAPSEESYGEKNWNIIEQEIKAFAGRINRYQEEQEEERMKRINRAGRLLLPFERPQERVYNILFFLNEYGSHFALDIMQALQLSNERHHLINL